VDRYGPYLVVQFLALGVERWRADILSLLAELASPRGIYERSDVDVRAKEGLDERAGVVYGEEPPAQLEIREDGRRSLVDVRGGHKTGCYLDQRENRARLAPFCEGADVLDVFAYAGAFATCALSAGAARATLVESSAAALALAERNRALNNVARDRFECVDGDAFSVLRGYRGQGRRFDLIVLDPPKLARTQRNVKRAARAYKDVNLLAFQLLEPGGVLFTTSCSGAVSADLFQKIVFGALVDAGRDGQVVGYLAQGADHPVALTYPEGAYLKGLIVRVV
jgi:23S rRNA (cytosine1962-C5)-methyltransferase